jgi:ABC-type transport system substrate-binding protein
VLRLLQEAPALLDPARIESVYEALPVGQLFDGLVTFDAALNVVPAAAATWTISRDGLTYTFNLRPGVRFHDGRPLTAEDVEFTIRRQLDPRQSRHGLAFPYLLVIKGAEQFAHGGRRDLPGVVALDPLRIQIRLERPRTSFLEVLAMDALTIVSKHAVTASGDARFARAPIGTGPFKLQSWSAEKLRLVANPDYFAGPPHLDAVEIVFPRADERDGGTARFLRGEIDLIELGSDNYAQITTDPGVRVERYQEMSVSFLGLLTGCPPLDDARIRRAVAHAVNREALVSEAPATRRTAAGILPPGLPAYSPRDKTIPYDAEAAKRLLAEAGHPNGKDLRPLVIYGAFTNPVNPRVAQRLREDLAEVGIPVDVRQVSWSEFMARVEDHAAPAFVLTWVADLPDPDTFLQSLFQSGNASNYFDFQDGEVDDLLERAAVEVNPVARAHVYQDVERRILGLAPVVPFYHPLGTVALRKEVHGLEVGPMGLGAVQLQKVWIESRHGQS